MRAPVDFDRTRAIQWQASDPSASAWVIANAGSGKTHVLTQRVIRLLLSGADPAAILCLTFTKVAAAEMSRRIFGILGKWTTLPDRDLAAAIADLQGSPAPADRLRRARRLFARALETPGGLKIQTIHAFCERLLQQFPFEANVPGQFTILDDTAAAALIAGARGEVLQEAARQPQARLGMAMRYLAEHAADSQIDAALEAVIAKREAIRRWIEISAAEEGAGGIDDSLAHLRGLLGLHADESEEAICRQICEAADWGRDDCGALVEAVAAAENRGDHGARAALEAIGAAESLFDEAEQRIAFFLIEDKDAGGWKPRRAAHRFNATFGRGRFGLPESFGAESERVFSLAQRLVPVRNYAATEALLVVGDAILQSYHAGKRRAGALDFGDLIVKTRNLLSRSDAAVWVLYKLDARVEHILVDEAQDTSPDQWAVVQAIAADFFAGRGAVQAPRSIFAVGDDKQSIFGFQGAAPHMLAEMERFFARRAKDAEAAWGRHALQLSFRSTSEVLDAVDRVFAGALEAKVTASGYEMHAARRHGEPGHVVVLPRTVRVKRLEPEDWTAPFDAPAAADVELAEKIAGEIAKLLGTALPSGKRVKPGEILILARKRDAFVTAMNRALRGRRVRTAGADRIPVATHIAVLDLLALADAMLLPQDDLQLAACLKSPLLGLGEEELLELAAGRGGSLWSALQASARARIGEAAKRLSRWRGMADQVSPFRFFATVLGPDGGRCALAARLGGEADDVLDAFLSQALAYEAIEPPSLQGFLAFIRASGRDIKREAEEAGASVRVMTVHGAKGLEADVVFLVDTGGQIVHGQHRDVLVRVGDKERGEAFLWRRFKAEATELQRRADAQADKAAEEEYLRLLYVAMTRARDLLYVCGIRPARPPEGCWYAQVERALVPDGVERDAQTGELAQPFVWPQPLRAALEAREEAHKPATDVGDVPRWLSRPAPSPLPAPQPLRPSRALAEPDPRPGQAADPAPAWTRPDGTALARGRLVHRLLQALPALSQDQRSRAAESYLSEAVPYDAELSQAIRRETQAVLADPRLREAFGPDSRAEVAIVGRVATDRGDYAVSGQIDRLVRTATGWHILDFKTNRSVPAGLADVEPAYVLQLALYRRLLMRMQPGAEIHATLVWTAAPNVMPIPAAAMERALAKLGIRAIDVA